MIQLLAISLVPTAMMLAATTVLMTVLRQKHHHLRQGEGHPGLARAVAWPDSFPQ
jgi:hypothetical protein